jgi:hypothetical protein
MAGVGDLICQVDNLGFKERMASGAGERVESLPHLMGEIETVEFRIFNFQLFDDAEALAASTEAAAILHELVESLFHRTTERGMPEVAGEGDGFSQVLIERKRTAEGAGQGGDFNRVSKTGADMIPGAVEGDLGFVFEATEGGTVNDAFAVPLEFRAEIVGFLRVFPTQALPTF